MDESPTVRRLDWRGIDQAPSGQKVLLWNKWTGDFGTGKVVHRPDGAYEVDSDVFSATHYAVIEGPGP